MKKLIILITVLAFWGCDKDSTGSGNGEDYSFKLNIKDSSGVPISNAESKVRYRVMCNYSNGEGECVDRLSRVMPATSIQFQIGEDTFNSLFVYNLDNEIVDTLIYGTTQVGFYTATFACSDCDPSYKSGVKVFRYVLESKTIESNEVIFRDTKYMVLINGAIDVDQLATAGITDADGNFQTDSTIWFPTLYNLSEFIGMDEMGNPTNNFYLTDVLSDSIEIRVNIAGSIFATNYKIVNGINDIEIIIPNELNRSDESISTLEQTSPYRSNYNSTNQSNSISSSMARDKIEISILRTGFSLSQNHPNPFN